MWDLLHSAMTGVSLVPVVGSLASIVVLWLVGRLLVGRDLPALVTFGAGWGLAVLAMTVLGTQGDGSFGLLAWVLWTLAGLSLLMELRQRQIPPVWMALVLSLPLALLISGRIASEWDEFSHWLHAFRYLDAYQTLPGKGRPSIESCCAAYPYGWPLLGWLSSRLIGFSEAVPGLLNLFQLALCGDLLACILAKNENPRWRHQAWGLLLVTLLGTTFVPKLVFTAYADVPTAAMMLAMVWLVAQDEQKLSFRGWLALGLCGATLVSMKPSNLVLAVMVFGVGAVLALRLSWRHMGLRFLRLGLAFVPVAVTWLIWRHFVGANLSGEELVIRPWGQWNLGLWADILLGMLDVASNKGGYFGIMALTLLWWAASLFRPSLKAAHLAQGVALVFIGYNAFLYFTYLAVFLPEDAHRVASYWRYNTHLGLLTALIVCIVYREFGARLPIRSSWGRPVTAIVLVLLIFGPYVAVRHIRFDLLSAKLFLRQTFDQVAAIEKRAIVILDPKGSGLSHVMASYHWDGHPKVASFTTAFDGDDLPRYRMMFDKGSVVLVLSWSDAVKALLPGLAPGNDAVLAEKDGTVLARYPYPGNIEPKVYP